MTIGSIIVGRHARERALYCQFLNTKKHWCLYCIGIAEKRVLSTLWLLFCRNFSPIFTSHVARTKRRRFVHRRYLNVNFPFDATVFTGGPFELDVWVGRMFELIESLGLVICGWNWARYFVHTAIISAADIGRKMFLADLTVIRANKMPCTHAKHLSYGFCRTSKVINTNVININNLMDYDCIFAGKILAKVVAPPAHFLLLRLIIIFNRMQNVIHSSVRCQSPRGVWRLTPIPSNKIARCKNIDLK